MPLFGWKLFRKERRVAVSIEVPIVEATAKEIMEAKESGIPLRVVAASHLAAKSATRSGFGLFNFLGGAGS